MIEHPVRNEFKLVEDKVKPTEVASDVYRFEVKVPAGKTESQVVTEERIISQGFQVSNIDDNQIRIFLNSPVTSDKVKKGLQNAMELRWSVAKTQRDIQEQEKQLKVITDDQTRLRANLKEMPVTAAAYKRYLEKFDTQETQIEQYQADIKMLHGVEFKQTKELEDYLSNFSAE
jgi:predicted RNase H-like nuclease (RuvC/YqgF family)